jgi:hypothetical protein
MVETVKPSTVEERRDKRDVGDNKFVKSFQNLGDIKGFLVSVVKYAVVVVVLGYVGATVINMTNMSGAELDDLFPTDLQNFPYQTPVGRVNPQGNSIASLYTEYHASADPESLTRATLEFIFPMKRQSFPYTSWFLQKEFETSKGHTIAQWFASTCAGTFAAWRKFYKILIVLGKWGHSVAGTLADLFLFYVYPVIAIYLIMLPIIPIVGFILCIFSSTMYNIPGAWIFTFAPLMGFLMAIANIFNAGMLNLFAWVISLLIFSFGFAMGFINVAWWGIIGIALWVFTIAFAILSPLLHKGGIKNVVKEFIKKRKGLMYIFVVLVVISALKKLNNTLKIGVIVGAIYCLYKIFKLPSTANGVLPPTTPPVPAKA